jgi:immune inhibitor A
MKHLLRLLGVVAALALLAVPAALSAGGSDESGASASSPGSDYLPGSKAAKQVALRQAGLELKLNGTIAPNAKIANVAKGQYVELAREGEDAIWTVLAEFGTQAATHNHGALGTINHAGAAGPLHNQIPQPDRTKDNTTIWTANFDRPHYLDLLFDEGAGVNSMRQFYIEQSSGRYAVNGDVTDWVKVPFNEAAYGSNYCGSIVCTRDIQRLLEDELVAWYNGQKAAGKSDADINAYLSRFDKWDRYDYDGDGNFTEPDGYIDHFQSIHAGEGEETGGGAQGTNAIWSHRSYTNLAGSGVVGPSFNKLGGVPVGGSNYWVGDYTIEPENGGVGVFAHEYAHDLGLPDEYDTSGNTGGAENSTGFWTIMSSGSYGNDGTQDIGSKPTGFNAWDKFQLGWLNYEVAKAGNSEHKLGPAVYNTKQAQGVFVVLPPSLNSTTLTLGTPTSPSNAWYSTSGNNLDVNMTRDVTLPTAPSITLNLKAWYEIETCWDYAYLRVSTNGGTTWTNLHTNVSDSGNENGQNFGEGITGISGAAKVCDAVSGNPAWVPVTADLTPYAGKTVKLQVRYWTDGAAVGRGFEFDDLSITAGATTVFSDNAESGDNGWTLAGFRRTTGSDTTEFPHYYLAENRQYAGYDDSLRTGPYNFGFLNTLPNYAERFPYQDGLLIWYWNTAQTNNNVGDHPGKGLILPVDARPSIQHWADGTMMRPRLQAFDSTFGLSPTDAITLHKNGVGVTIPSQPAVPVFNDLNSYWTANDGHAHGNDAAGDHYQPGWSSVAVPKSGTQIRVKSETPGGFTQIQVSSGN